MCCQLEAHQASCVRAVHGALRHLGRYRRGTQCKQGLFYSSHPGAGGSIWVRELTHPLNNLPTRTSCHGCSADSPAVCAFRTLVVTVAMAGRAAAYSRLSKYRAGDLKIPFWIHTFTPQVYSLAHLSWWVSEQNKCGLMIWWEWNWHCTHTPRVQLLANLQLFGPNRASLLVLLYIFIYSLFDFCK